MKKITIFLLIMGLFHTSCDDYLDKIPQDAFTEGSLFQTEADLRGFLNTIYNQQFGFSLTNNWPNRGLDVMTVWSEDAYGVRDCCSSSDLITISNGGKTNNIYNDSYTRIRQINEFLNYAPQAEASFTDPALYRRYIAEARFHRAYYYHRLNTFFGPVPLVLEPIGALDFLERNTRLSVFEWIDKELEDVANDLPDTFTGEDVGRITSWAAKALRGRHLLYGIGWHPDVASIYSRAEAVLSDVYDNSGHSLEPGAEGYQRLFTKEGNGSPESLWTKYYDPTTYGAADGGTGTSHGYPFFTLPTGSAAVAVNRNSPAAFGATSRLVEAYQMTNGMDIHDAGSGYDESTPWDNRDPRLEITILHAGEELPRRGGSSLEDTYILNPHPLLGTTTLDDVNRNVNRTGYYYNKYNTEFDWGVDSKRADIQYHFIRFAEVILLYAEAALGNTGNVTLAMSLVNEVRSRVGMPEAVAATADAALDAILFERRIELALEGPFRYYDLRRHRLGEEVFIGTLPGGGDKAMAYGIPLGDGRVPDANVLEGDLDDSKKREVGPKTFDATYYLPEIPAQAIDRNPLLANEPVDFGPWESFFQN
ncbi:RagB/SusD family nutrient uptake outer membrane protein [Fulvivirgaceae bacterium BMA12]|uniref:RagB/SusD family nutrient uptake outer membrane protein n=1 Tax=Agaribacillus aureus TaxID=3051825 RepID=A0ABT8LGD7_9BACT|nr:RagB/SusD family nutrient uptake outer membrane protein [Fulvivirgaceae bacterium BMA12]